MVPFRMFRSSRRKGIAFFFNDCGGKVSNVSLRTETFVHAILWARMRYASVSGSKSESFAPPDISKNARAESGLLRKRFLSVHGHRAYKIKHGCPFVSVRPLQGYMQSRYICIRFARQTTTSIRGLTEPCLFSVAV
jgi:hypothetical protein